MQAFYFVDPDNHFLQVDQISSQYLQPFEADWRFSQIYTVVRWPLAMSTLVITFISRIWIPMFYK